jgi:hypothetical protein
MKAIRLVIATALVAGAIAVGSASSAAPAMNAARSPATLAGKTVLVGKRAGVIDVRIPTPARWSGESADVRITGGGELPGFVLTQMRTTTFDHPILGPIENELEEVVVTATRLPKKGILRGLSSDSRTWVMSPREEILKPGNYKLYLVADGEPVRVTISLGGLLGRSKLSPTRKVGLDMKLLPERTSATSPAAGVYTAGDDDVLERPGLIFNTMVVQVEDSPEGEVGSCVYRGEPVDEEQGEVVSYGPHCLGGQGRDYSSASFGYTSNYTEGEYKGMYGYTPVTEADRWTVSNWMRGTGTIGKGVSYGFWLNYG